MQRLLDRFNGLRGGMNEEFVDSDLKLASACYSVLHSACRNRGRLNDALLLTLGGCCSHWWQVASVCHCAAAEALLTYSKQSGVTKRLAASYACLVETEPAQRGAAWQEFRDLYQVRSDIMHGRAQEVVLANPQQILNRFGTMIRTLWRAVISERAHTALEGTDAEREVYFQRLQSGYRAP